MLRQMYHNVFWWFFLLLPSCMYGQSLSYESYQSNDGLADNIVFKIMQASDGQLYIGTDDGLSKFDGKAFKNFRGNRTNFIIDIKELPDGSMLLGSWKGGLQLFRKDTIISPVSNAPSSNILQMQVHDGSVTAWNSIVLISGEVGKDSIPLTLHFLHHEDHSSKLSLTSNKKEKLPLQNTRYFRPSKEKLWAYHSMPGILEMGPDSLFHEIRSGDTIFFIDEAFQHQLWATTKGKLLSLSPPNRTITKNLEQLRIGRFQFASAEKVFFHSHPTSNRKLYEYNIETGLLHEISTPLNLNSTISNILVDHEKSLWVGTNGDGMRRVRYPYMKTLTTEIQSPFITAITHTPDGSVWVGTDANGMFEIDTKSLSVIKTIPWTGAVRCLAVNEQNETFIGLDNSNFLNHRIFLPNNRLKSLATLGKNWWIGWGRQTVSIYKNHPDAKNRTIHLADGAYEIRQGFVDKRMNEIWLATSKGVLVLDIQGHEGFTWKDYFPKGERLIADPPDQISQTWIGEAEGLISENTFDVKREKNGEIWVATDKGLSKIPTGDQPIENFTDGRIWPERINTLLVDDNGVVWLGSKKGLAFFTNGNFGLFTRENGLVTNEVTALHCDQQQQLWVGGIQGVSVFDIHEKPVILPPPEVHIHERFINDLHDEAKQSQLTQTDKIKITFRANTLLPADEIDYKVKLGKRP
ncbi:MAG: hypothetical protein AAGA66_05680, partial [Bacteroidota bacterium]